MVILHTNHGDITLELDAENAPATVANFLQYVRDGHYDNTIFHRVIDGFMVQGGGMAPGMKEKLARAGWRGQGPVVTFMFFRFLMPPLVFIGALIYLFAISSLAWPFFAP